MAGPLPSSPEWTRAVYPNALPYMMQHRCFDYCLPSQEFELRYMPSPCVCSVPGPAISPWSAQAPVGQQARLPAPR